MSDHTSPDAGRTQRPPRRASRAARVARVTAIAGAALLSLILADYWAYPRWCPVGGQSLNRGENGLWLRYPWYFGQRTDADLRRLAEELPARQIRYAYFHVREVTAEGRLRFGYPESARRLVTTLHQRAPSVKAIAWVYAGNRRGRGSMDLRRPVVRRTMVAEAVWLVGECGFDGVQWDYEICESGERGFEQLMRETRAALPPGKLLSAAVPVWAPWPFPQRKKGWTEEDFVRIAPTCDQLAVMCYDSGLYLPRLYVWLVRQQAFHVTRAVERGSPHCRVLLGLPTYNNSTRAHHPHAESLRLALKGVREGLANPRAVTSAFSGVALFADYTTDADEWRTYERLWLRPTPEAGPTLPEAVHERPASP